MLVKKIIELISVAVIAIVMTGCGGGGDNAAIDKLISYATTGEPVPTAQDYADAGVVGVTGDNVASVNAFILGLVKEQVDTKEEVQALADEAGVSLAPRAVIVVSRNFAPKGGSIRFDGSSSADLDGTIVSYVWSREGNNLSNEVTFTTTSLPHGTHIITLTVTDDDGNVGQATVQVRIEDVNEPPVANAGPDQDITVLSGFARITAYDIQEGPGATTVTLNGSGSSDDGKPQPLTYLWEGISQAITFNNKTSVSPTFDLSCFDNTYPAFITVKLTVSDGASSATDTVKINTNYNNCQPD